MRLSVEVFCFSIVPKGSNWLRYQTPAPEQTNPQILEALAVAQIPVVTLSEIERSLEDVYLQIIQRPDPVEVIEA